VAKFGECRVGVVQVMECAYWLKTASHQECCELTNCLDAESIISSSTIPAFSSSFVLGTWSEPPNSMLNQPFDPQESVNHDYVSDAEVNNHHCLHLQLAYSCFFHSQRSVSPCINVLFIPMRIFSISQEISD
jgi:hypothetical protein